MERTDNVVRETRVLLLRHAETAEPGRFHGAESDVGLGAWGHRQAEVVAQDLAELRPSALYCSAMLRARETAVPIAHACALEPSIVESLHERRMGPLSGVQREAGLAAYEEAKARWRAGELDYTHEGGESYLEIRERVVPALWEIVERHVGETIIVVAHGVVIRVALTTLLEGYGPEDFDRIGIANCGVNDLRWDGERWRAEGLNQEPSGNARPGPCTDGFRY
ncbi:MAG: histidine phosphatase family protein [Isosphaeraceae bacterium]|nr:histidine phosphatase family protein [Isosphaeraceae bacterium]